VPNPNPHRPPQRRTGFWELFERREPFRRLLLLLITVGVITLALTHGPEAVPLLLSR
jgi:hypothetical protein